MQGLVLSVSSYSYNHGEPLYATVWMNLYISFACLPAHRSTTTEIPSIYSILRIQ